MRSICRTNSNEAVLVQSVTPSTLVLDEYAMEVMERKHSTRRSDLPTTRRCALCTVHCAGPRGAQRRPDPHADSGTKSTTWAARANQKFATGSWHSRGQSKRLCGDPIRRGKSWWAVMRLDRWRLGGIEDEEILSRLGGWRELGGS
jgi:hypothetical protein